VPALTSLLPESHIQLARLPLWLRNFSLLLHFICMHTTHRKASIPSFTSPHYTPPPTSITLSILILPCRVMRPEMPETQVAGGSLRTTFSLATVGPSQTTATVERRLEARSRRTSTRGRGGQRAADDDAEVLVVALTRSRDVNKLRVQGCMSTRSRCSRRCCFQRHSTCECLMCCPFTISWFRNARYRSDTRCASENGCREHLIAARHATP